MFTPQEIQSEMAIGVQVIPDATKRSIISVNMFDSQSLSCSYYVNNSVIPFTGTKGKKLQKLVAQPQLPTDAAFFAIPGYHRLTFPFVLMEVASKGEVYITNTNSWFKQLAVKMVKDHQEDAIA